MYSTNGFIPESLIVHLLLATFNSTFLHTFKNQASSECKSWSAITLIMVFRPPSENTRQRSDAFAAQNNLPKFEYVLHPRTTGFTFIVDRLRKGEEVSHNTVDDSCGTHILPLRWKHQQKLRKMTCLYQTRWCWLILLVVFKPQTCVSGFCQPLRHLRDSLVSVWANAGSPPEFLNTPSQYPPTQATAPP